MTFEKYITSRTQLLAELAEKTDDLTAFSQAREIVRRRVLEVAESTCALTPLPHWSGTDAVLGSLDLSIHAIERTVAELRGLLEGCPDDKPKLSIVKGDV